MKLHTLEQEEKKAFHNYLDNNGGRIDLCKRTMDDDFNATFVYPDGDNLPVIVASIGNQPYKAYVVHDAFVHGGFINLTVSIYDDYFDSGMCEFSEDDSMTHELLAMDVRTGDLEMLMEYHSAI